MNIFVLSTGRCGSTTFTKACQHITNYTAAHESRGGFLGADRFEFADNHIESDNRLSWFLGRLDRHYGDQAIYVHLRRDDERTAQSYLNRYNRGILRAYREKILMRLCTTAPPLDVCLDYCDTVNTNIELFLRGKPRQMNFRMESGRRDFRRFWDLIKAEGDLDAALAEWDVAHNPSKPKTIGQKLLNAVGIRN